MQISALYGTPRYTSAYPTFVTAAMAVGGAQGASYRLSTDAIMFSSIAIGPEGALCASQSHRRLCHVSLHAPTPRLACD